MQSPADLAGVRPWPARRHCAVLALVFTAAAVYGALVPFHYEPLGLPEALDRFAQVPLWPLSIGARADLAANVLLFVPIGFFWLGVFLLDRGGFVRTALAVPVVMMLSVTISLAIEFGQCWFPLRVPSLFDVFAQTTGAIVGMALWLAAGEPLARWIRSLGLAAHPNRYLGFVLQAYLLGLAIYSLQPFDLTISVTDLVHKYREGRIAVVPWESEGPSLAQLVLLACHACTFVPVGMLAATWLRPARRPVRSLGASAVVGGLIVLAIAMAQLLVRSRATVAADAIGALAGVLAGAWLVRFLSGRGLREQQAADESRSGRRALVWLGLAGGYAVLMGTLLSTPAEPIRDVQQLKARYLGFFCVPFARLERSGELDIALELAKKLSLSAPLGALLAMAVVPLPVPAAIRRILLAGSLLAVVGIGTAIEMAQVVLRPHVPDASDVILYTAGAAAGMFVVMQIAGARARRRPSSVA